jgi:protein-tyrosine-phosphatase
MNQEKIYNVLFLCTGNSARSILAEATMNSLARAGSAPTAPAAFPPARSIPSAMKLLELQAFPTEGLRSKSWSEFAEPGSPSLDFVFTVCDNAAHEVCPVWPGQPMSAHWGVEDPAAEKAMKRRKCWRSARRCANWRTASRFS